MNSIPMNSERLDSGWIETGAHVIFVTGTLAVFQNAFEALYPVGLILITIGVIGSLLALMLKRALWQRVLERFMLLGMIVGITAMFQPWDIILYEYGFYVLALTTLGFIIVSHIPVRAST